MGRRDRERIQAIIEGKITSIREKRDILGHEVVKLAAEKIFGNPAYDDRGWEYSTQEIAEVICKVLPEAIRRTGIKYFSEADLLQKGDWNSHYCHVIKGVLSRGKDFSMPDRKGELWKIRKDQRGRKRTGTWQFCLFCGEPFYRSASSNQRWHTIQCYLADRKLWKKLANERQLTKV